MHGFSTEKGVRTRSADSPSHPFLLFFFSFSTSFSVSTGHCPSEPCGKDEVPCSI